MTNEQPDDPFRQISRFTKRPRHWILFDCFVCRFRRDNWRLIGIFFDNGQVGFRFTRFRFRGREGRRVLRLRWLGNLLRRRRLCRSGDNGSRHILSFATSEHQASRKHHRQRLQTNIQHGMPTNLISLELSEFHVIWAGKSPSNGQRNDVASI